MRKIIHLLVSALTFVTFGASSALAQNFCIPNPPDGCPSPALAIVATSSVLYVDARVCVGDGSSWARDENATPPVGGPTRDLVKALEFAKQHEEITEIRIASGTAYCPSSSADKTFDIRPGLRVIAGWRGIAPGGGNPDEFLQGGAILSGVMPNGDHSFHTVTAIAPVAGTILQNLAIYDGIDRADSSNPYRGGGGLHVREGIIELIDCNFVNNSSRAFGGAIFVYHGTLWIDHDPTGVSQPTRERSTHSFFGSNRAPAGTAIAGEQSDVYVTRADFEKNWMLDQSDASSEYLPIYAGGVILVGGVGPEHRVLLDRCSTHNNHQQLTCSDCPDRSHISSELGGVLCVLSQASGTLVTVDRSDFSDEASINGGGIYAYNSDLVVCRTSFRDVRAGSESFGCSPNCPVSRGGSILYDGGSAGGSLYVASCRFQSSSEDIMSDVVGYSGEGAGIDVVSSTSDCEIVNCSFTALSTRPLTYPGDNTGKGATIATASPMRLSHVTLRNNLAGGLLSTASTGYFIIENSILWNPPFQNGRQVKGVSSASSFAYSDIFLASSATETGIGVINSDPQFVDTGDLNEYRIENIVMSNGTAFSPCYNSGNQALAVVDICNLDSDCYDTDLVSVDLEDYFDYPVAFHTRIRPQFGEVDMGAYEIGVSDQCKCPVDFNEDGGNDGADVEEFYQMWQEGATCTDVNCDGGVDGADLEYFFEKWEAGEC
ncbi:MAG: hypothetical protein JSR77_04490 [Planctomycetes bacterium]|nr:hypothetical protein [Planctomycetota bacterium]